MEYLHWDEQMVTDLSETNVTAMYERGYVFTRIGKGAMQKTRSVRIDLSKFEMSSENRRIIKKTEGVEFVPMTLPLADYTFVLGKMAKDFYDLKFGPGIMSAQKTKEILTDQSKSNFNSLLTYMDQVKTIGWAISYENKYLLHYSYPFYNLESSPKDMGLGMMIRAIEYAKSQKKKYVYLGSLQRPADTYKIQFSGLEWFDGQSWQKDFEPVKKILASVKM